jgi:hypothetical protein
VTAPAEARPHTDAAVKAIEDLVEAQASTVLVGRGVPPPGSGWQGEPGISVFRPFVVVYPSPGSPDGSLAEPMEYLDYSAQATCVSASSEAVESVVDLVKVAWVNAPIPVPGRFCYRGQVLSEGQVSREDSVAPAIHYVTLRVGWRTQAVS